MSHFDSSFFSLCLQLCVLQKLEKMLRAYLGVKGLLSRTDNLIGAVTLGGDHKERTVAWLRTMGF